MRCVQFRVTISTHFSSQEKPLLALRLFLLPYPRRWLTSVTSQPRYIIAYITGVSTSYHARSRIAAWKSAFSERNVDNRPTTSIFSALFHMCGVAQPFDRGLSFPQQE